MNVSDYLWSCLFVSYHLKAHLSAHMMNDAVSVHRQGSVAEKCDQYVWQGKYRSHVYTGKRMGGVGLHQVCRGKLKQQELRICLSSTDPKYTGAKWGLRWAGRDNKQIQELNRKVLLKNYFNLGWKISVLTGRCVQV